MDPSFMEEGDCYPLERIPDNLIEVARDKLKRRGLSLVKQPDGWSVEKLK